ncbi:MAG: 1-acyl-sn-glycerol-3-phosphate acyltransferase [Burkholderiales bacterium]|nr:1-acyl-sn-glycerol-3-phosphate acyltransferase [Anaerolineae bacterium]
MSQTNIVAYPRRVLLRGFVRHAGRTLMSALTRPIISGQENLPERGPLLLVGNHVAMMEVVMMVLYAPWNVEILGAGDIPIDPRYARIAATYGFIPIKRGSVDRGGLNKALSVLQQGGIIGMFPEGGIWETKIKQARAGVAWLSHQAQAPILPMGFGGMEGAITGLMRLQRPQLVMNIGPVIPPINADVPGKSRKDALDDAANMIMERIEELIPDEEKMRSSPFIEEHYDFQLSVRTANSQPITLPEGLGISDPEALGKFFFRPVLLDALRRNLKRPVGDLQRFETVHDALRITNAAQAVLDYLNENPHFFTYRFGYAIGGAMKQGFVEIRDIARWAANNGAAITLKPIRRYRLAEDGEELVEETPGAPHEI